MNVELKEKLNNVDVKWAPTSMSEKACVIFLWRTLLRKRGKARKKRMNANEIRFLLISSCKVECMYVIPGLLFMFSFNHVRWHNDYIKHTAFILNSIHNDWFLSHSFLSVLVIKQTVCACLRKGNLSLLLPSFCLWNFFFVRVSFRLLKSRRSRGWNYPNIFFHPAPLFFLSPFSFLFNSTRTILDKSFFV